MLRLLQGRWCDPPCAYHRFHAHDRCLQEAQRQKAEAERLHKQRVAEQIKERETQKRREAELKYQERLRIQKEEMQRRKYL